MKTIRLHIILTLFLTALFPACSDFLSENPRDQIPEEVAQESLESIYLNYVASLYNFVGGYENSQGLQGTTRASTT